MLTEEQREKQNERQRQYYYRNREKAMAATATYRDAHPEKIREYNKQHYQRHQRKILARNKAYGLIRRDERREYMRDYRGMPTPLRAEPTHCECCNRLPGRSGRLELDHNHETGAFRGWLCHRCNLGLGNLGDTKHGLQRALEYLERACQTKPQEPPSPSQGQEPQSNSETSKPV